MLSYLDLEHSTRTKSYIYENSSWKIPWIRNIFQNSCIKWILNKIILNVDPKKKKYKDGIKWISYYIWIWPEKKIERKMPTKVSNSNRAQMILPLPSTNLFIFRRLKHIFMCIWNVYEIYFITMLICTRSYVSILHQVCFFLFVGWGVFPYQVLRWFWVLRLKIMLSIRLFY